jgi:hypothetical protein
MSLEIKDFKVYVPAKNFEESKRFYLDLGFSMTEGWGGTADFALGAARFRLQDYYVKDWASNMMFSIGVNDAQAWYERARELVTSGRYKDIRVKPPEAVDESLVTHVWDPSGVLLVFVQ